MSNRLRYKSNTANTEASMNKRLDVLEVLQKLPPECFSTLPGDDC